MEEKRDFSLTLVIDGRKYPLKIKRSEEEAYRSAAKEIDNKINQYRITYGDSSNLIPQDFIAMTAIQILVRNFKLGTKNNTQPYEDKITSLVDELDQYLEK
ncbi:MAG: cell division protein ZapA [Bacteroidales bacterium]|nr:cell division protein ZapA [Bacteroidales bacterium]